MTWHSTTVPTDRLAALPDDDPSHRRHRHPHQAARRQRARHLDHADSILLGVQGQRKGSPCRSQLARTSQITAYK